MNSHNAIFWITPYTSERFTFQNQSDSLTLFRNESHSFLRDSLYNKEKNCLLGGRRYAIPIPPPHLLTILRSFKSSEVLSDLFYTRCRLRMTSLTGIAKEQRSFLDLLSGQLGEFFTHKVYDTYLTRRWGIRGDQLASQLGRLLPQVLEDGKPAEVRPNVAEEPPVKIAIKDGLQITTRKAEYTTQKLWVDCPIHQVCTIIDDLPKSVQFSLEGIQYLQQTWIEVDGYDQSGVLHIFDDNPIYAVIPFGQNRGIALLRNDRLVATEELERGLAELRLSSSGPMRHLASFQPVWQKGSYTKFLHVLNYLTGNGIFPIANGSFAPVGDSLQQRYLQMLESGKGAEDVHRHLFDPFLGKMSLRSLRLI